MANAPVWLQSFDLLVCDLDGGSSSTEYVRAFGRHQVAWFQLMLPLFWLILVAFGENTGRGCFRISLTFCLAWPRHIGRRIPSCS